MNPLAILRQFIIGLLKENNPSQIGLGIAFGFVIGIIPKNNLTAQLIFIITMMTKANVPFAILSIFLFSSISFIFDKITDPVGYFILTQNSLADFFTKLYNMPIVPWTDFNNTVVLGGLVLGVLLFYPVYLLGRKFGIFYNERFRDKIKNSKIIKALKLSWLFEWSVK